jgi:hypothetical protein
VFEGQIAQPLIVITDQIVADGNVSLLFNGKLDKSHCDVLLPPEDRERLDALENIIIDFLDIIHHPVCSLRFLFKK